MHGNMAHDVVGQGGPLKPVRNHNIANNPNTEPAGFGECFLCGRGMVYRGRRFCSTRCREAFDCGFPRHDPHHSRSLMSLPLRSWKVAALAPGGPPIGSSYYGPILDRPRPAQKPSIRGQKVVSGPQSQKPKFVENNPATSMPYEAVFAMSSVAAERLAEPLKWEFWSSGRARSKTIGITLSPGLANDARLGIGRDFVCKSHDACHATGDGVIRIEHAITDDFPDGSPTLPVGDDESLWGLVARLPDGRTQWRRIYLQQNTVLPIGVADETVDHFQAP